MSSSPSAIAVPRESAFDLGAASLRAMTVAVAAFLVLGLAVPLVLMAVKSLQDVGGTSSAPGTSARARSF